MRPSRGFSLLEVLVALVIIAVGLMGVAKMHALTLSTASSAGTRSLVAIEAAGMAASIHANKTYWGGTLAALTTTVNFAGGNVVSVDPSSFVSGATDCTATYASTGAQDLAAFDVYQFGCALAQILPAGSAAITCQVATPPQSCTITVTWLENLVGLTSATSSAVISSAPAAASMPVSSNLIQQPRYTLYVEP